MSHKTKYLAVALLALAMLLTASCGFPCGGLNPSIDVEKYISVHPCATCDHGDWVDADDESSAVVVHYPTERYVSYLFVVTNDGKVPLTNVTLSDPGINVNVPMGTLAPCESLEVEVLHYCVNTVPTSNTAIATGEWMCIVCQDTDDAHFIILGK